MSPATIPRRPPRAAPVNAPATGVTSAGTRPWATEALLVLTVAIWGVNYSVVKIGTRLMSPRCVSPLSPWRV